MSKSLPLVLYVEYVTDDFSEPPYARLCANDNILCQSTREEHIGDLDDAQDWAVDRLKSLLEPR